MVSDASDDKFLSALEQFDLTFALSPCDSLSNKRSTPAATSSSRQLGTRDSEYIADTVFD